MAKAARTDSRRGRPPPGPVDASDLTRKPRPFPVFPRWRPRIRHCFLGLIILLLAAGGIAGALAWSRAREALRVSLEEGMADELVALLIRYRTQHGELGDAQALARAHPALVDSICRQRALYLARFGRPAFDAFLRDHARWAVLGALGSQATDLYRALYILGHGPDTWCEAGSRTEGKGAAAPGRPGPAR